MPKAIYTSRHSPAHLSLEPMSSVTEITVSYINKQAPASRPFIKDSEQAYRFIQSAYNMDIIALQEQFVVMYLNRTHRLLGVYRGALGAMSIAAPDIRIILSIALKAAASSLIISHNHPSGNLSPSKSDIEFTRQLAAAARVMNLKLLDHLILSPCGDYLSFSSERL
jgi:DNA repair protein RadC